MSLTEAPLMVNQQQVMLQEATDVLLLVLTSLLLLMSMQDIVRWLRQEMRQIRASLIQRQQVREMRPTTWRTNRN